MKQMNFNILGKIQEYAMKSIVNSEISSFTFNLEHASLTMNVDGYKNQIMVSGRYDSREYTYEYQILYDVSFVEWEIVEISSEGYGYINNIDFFQDFMELLI